MNDKATLSTDHRVSLLDAPPHYSSAGASAWADGYNAALKRLGWQPIETAPKDGRMFICWVRAVRYSDPDNAGDPPYEHDVSEPDFCMWKPNDGNGYWDNMSGTIGDAQDVTHWMPIPEAPKHV